MTNWQEEASKARTDLADAYEKIAGHDAEKAFQQGVIDGQNFLIKQKDTVIAAQDRHIEALKLAIESTEKGRQYLEQSRKMWKRVAFVNALAAFILALSSILRVLF